MNIVSAPLGTSTNKIDCQEGPIDDETTIDVHAHRSAHRSVVLSQQLVQRSRPSSTRSLAEKAGNECIQRPV